MTPNEYQKKAMETEADQKAILERLYEFANWHDSITAVRLGNAVRGLADDCGEVNGVAKRWLEYGQELDTEHMKEEVGDCLWRLAQICDTCGFTMEEAMEANIAKLQKVRYKDGYSETAAAEENRDREAERKVMESQLTRPDNPFGFTESELENDIPPGQFEAGRTPVERRDVLCPRCRVNWMPSAWVEEQLDRRLRPVCRSCYNKIASPSVHLKMTADAGHVYTDGPIPSSHEIGGQGTEDIPPHQFEVTEQNGHGWAEPFLESDENGPCSEPSDDEEEPPSDRVRVHTDGKDLNHGVELLPDGSLGRPMQKGDDGLWTYTDGQPATAETRRYAPVEAVPVRLNGRCACNGGTDCPLGKSEPMDKRCTTDELLRAGHTIRLDVPPRPAWSERLEKPQTSPGPYPPKPRLTETGVPYRGSYDRLCGRCETPIHRNNTAGVCGSCYMILRGGAGPVEPSAGNDADYQD